MTMFADKTLTCRDCGKDFMFTSGEQEFYAQRGLMNEPKRCSDCRQSRRAGDGPGAARSQREVHQVECSNCGKPAFVPFVPTGARPVYCAECFALQRGR